MSWDAWAPHDASNEPGRLLLRRSTHRLGCIWLGPRVVGFVMYHRESQIADTPNRIGLASYVYSLDNQTTSNYLAFATSAFDKHSLISTIQVAQSVISQSIIASLP